MSPEGEQAVDQLWKYQLRREHAALLEAFDAQKSSIRQMEERVNTLDTQMHKFMSDHAQLTQDVRSRMKDLEEFRKVEENIKSELHAMAERVAALKHETGKSQQSLPIAATNEPVTLVPEAPSSPTTSRHASPLLSTNTNKKLSQHVANTGLRKSRRLLHEEPSPPTVAPPVFTSLPDPPLTQEGTSIETFINRFDLVSTTTAPHDQRLLAAMFITGLDERKQQDIIVSALEKKKMVKIHENKQVEIRCVWDDVKKELERSDLLTREEKLPRKKRKGAGGK